MVVTFSSVRVHVVYHVQQTDNCMACFLQRLFLRPLYGLRNGPFHLPVEVSRPIKNDPHFSAVPRRLIELYNWRGKRGSCTIGEAFTERGNCRFKVLSDPGSHTIMLLVGNAFARSVAGVTLPWLASMERSCCCRISIRSRVSFICCRFC